VAADLTPAQSRFIEEMGQFLGGYGMTPMAGRMWGWLLLCDPPEQTAAQIAEALGASRGAVSGAARILTTAVRPDAAIGASTSARRRRRWTR
jgi:DNA-binding transcriptional regulator GbsR (MarR family)